MRQALLRLVAYLQVAGGPKLNNQEMEYDSTSRALTFERQINYQRSRPLSAGGILQFALQSELEQGARHSG